MARIRSVHPDICTSETIEALDDPDLEVTFTRLWTHCDDHGRCPDNLLLIKAAIYPLRERVTASVLDGWLNALAVARLIHRYEVQGKRYIAVRSWGEFQHPNRPKDSKCPEPPNYVPPPPNDDDDTDPTRNGHGRVTDDTVTPSASVDGPDPSAVRYDLVAQPRPDSSAIDAADVQEHAAALDAGTEHGRLAGSSPVELGDTDASLIDHVPDTPGVGEGEGEGEGVGARGERAVHALALVPTNSPPPPVATRTTHSLTSYPADFEAWWTLYPRKLSKRDARDAYRRALGHATQTQLANGLRRSLEAWRQERRPPDKVPYPAKWLNGRCWEDEHTTPATTTEPKAYDSIRAALQRRGSA